MIFDSFLEILRNEMKKVNTDTLYLIVSPYAKDDLLQQIDRLEKMDGAVHLIVPYYDAYPYVKNRAYAEGWEVPINV